MTDEFGGGGEFGEQIGVEWTCDLLNAETSEIHAGPCPGFKRKTLPESRQCLLDRCMLASLARTCVEVFER